MKNILIGVLTFILLAQALVLNERYTSPPVKPEAPLPAKAWALPEPEPEPEPSYIIWDDSRDKETRAMAYTAMHGQYWSAMAKIEDSKARAAQAANVRREREAWRRTMLNELNRPIVVYGGGGYRRFNDRTCRD